MGGSDHFIDLLVSCVPHDRSETLTGIEVISGHDLIGGVTGSLVCRVGQLINLHALFMITTGLLEETIDSLVRDRT